jgi:hypothetical protein
MRTAPGDNHRVGICPQGARVCRPEHLMAILVQTGRAKDRARLQMFLEEAEFDRALFEALIDRFGLRERWTASAS